MARVCNLTETALFTSELHFAALVWLCWNRHIETYATWRFRVEDDYLPELCSRANLPCKPHTWSLAGAPEAERYWQNHRSHEDVTWVALEEESAETAAEVRALGRAYGYTD